MDEVSGREPGSRASPAPDIPVRDTHVTATTPLGELVRQYEAAGGFVAKKVGQATGILKEMFQHSKLSVLSFPAAIVSTGTRGVLVDLLRSGKFQIVMTTCGTLDHDFARLWRDYHHGSFDDDDIELQRQGKHRLGNIRIPQESYGGIIEEQLQPLLQDIYQAGARTLAPHELVWELGRRLEQHPRREESLIYWCWKKQIPMIIPGITDGAFGLQLLLFIQDHKDFRVDVWEDEFLLLGRMFEKQKTGALMIGGGISKHHTIWWSQFKEGLDYAVYITTAPEWDGSLSGARVEEGISWGKVSPKALYVTVEGDATVLLPLIAGPLL